MILGHVLFVSTFLALCFGKPDFASKIPNGNNVYLGNELWIAVGHTLPSMGGLDILNPFGIKAQELGIQEATFVWADELCGLDSDGDGRSNGEELGDPNCIWQVGDDPQRTNNITHPGFPDNEADTILSELDDSMPRKVLLHIICMCSAWIFFAPAGVLIALVHKKGDSRGLPCHWFHLHRAFVGIAVALTFIGYWLIYFHVDKFKYDTNHTLAGTAVAILCILQPLSGIFRVHLPEKGQLKSKLRIGWEYFHQWMGRGLILLAVITLILGFQTSIDDFGYVDQEVGDIMTAIIWVLFGLGSIFGVVFIFFFRGDFADILPRRKSIEDKKAQEYQPGQTKTTEEQIKEIDEKKANEKKNKAVELA